MDQYSNKGSEQARPADNTRQTRSDSNLDSTRPDSPRQAKRASRQDIPDVREGGIWRIFVFMFFLVTALILAYAGLNFGYKAFLNNSINNLDAEIEDIAGRFESGESRDLIIFYSQMVNLRELLDSHIFASRIFPFLESATNSNVVYSTVGISTENNELTIDGIASSFQNLVQQLLFWQRSPNIEDIVLRENSLAGDNVVFRATLVMNPEFFHSSPEYLEIIRTRSPSGESSGFDESEDASDEEVEFEEPINNEIN